MEDVRASMGKPGGVSSVPSVEKKPVRSRGWGVKRVLPDCSTRWRTCRWGVSGLTLTILADWNCGRVARLLAAMSAFIKLGMRWWTGLCVCGLG